MRNLYSSTGKQVFVCIWCKTGFREQQTHLVTPPSIWTQNSCDIVNAGMHSVNCDANASGCPPLYNTHQSHDHRCTKTFVDRCMTRRIPSRLLDLKHKALLLRTLCRSNSQQWSRLGRLRQVCLRKAEAVWEQKQVPINQCHSNVHIHMRTISTQQACTSSSHERPCNNWNDHRHPVSRPPVLIGSV